MLVLDTGAREGWRKAADREKSAASLQETLAHDILSNTITVEDDAGCDTSNLVAQLGRPMTAQDVIRKLKLCNSKLIFTKHPTYALYGIYIEREQKKVHICGMESGIMPEFSVLHKTTKRVANPELFGKEKPTREVDWMKVPTFASETRGYRTVLVRLLHQKLITQSQVEQHFGWTPTRQSEKWHQQTKETIHVTGS